MEINMKRINIASVHEAEYYTNQRPNHFNVVSITDPNCYMNLPNANSIIRFDFHDVSRQNENGPQYKLVTGSDCAKALAFMKNHDDLLVHCHAGISRSTAIALGYLLTQFKRYQDAVEHLYVIRPIAIPNKRILAFMCRINGLSFSAVYDACEKEMERYDNRNAKKVLK